MAIGMSVPGATDLGFGISQADQETEEQRRKRLLAQQQERLLPGLAAGASSLMQGYGAAVPRGL